MNRTKNDHGTREFNKLRVCFGRTVLMMTMVLMNIKLMEVEGVRLEAWQKIYDHWDLRTKGFKSGCRSDPCDCWNDGDYSHSVGCTNNNITSLTLSNNKLTGSIPAELGELKALINLRLNNNQLTGSIPAELGELKALISLRLYNNQLTYPAPPSVITLCNKANNNNNGLACLGVGQTWSGAWQKVYDHWDLGTTREYKSECRSDPCLSSCVGCKNGNITFLVLGNYQLTGSIPAELGELKALTNLDLVTTN